jgi:NADPH:quinone reductase-like Zn-dependent oxidoreductase
VENGPTLIASVRAAIGGVDAVMDAAQKSDLVAAAELVGDRARIVTLTGSNGAAIGVRPSGPIPAGIPGALAEAMARLAEGALTLRSHTVVPLAAAADAHARLEAGERTKFLLAI